MDKESKPAGREFGLNEGTIALVPLVLTVVVCIAALGISFHEGEHPSAEDMLSVDWGWNIFPNEHGLGWRFDDATGTLTIASMDGQDHDIPDYPNQDQPWQNLRLQIKALVTEDHVTSIGYAAFSTHTAMTSAHLLGVKTVGEISFMMCIALQSIYLPEATVIQDFAFYFCSVGPVLDSTNLPKVTEIGKCAFTESSGLTAIDLPNITHVNTEVFGYCENLKTVNLPNVTTIDDYAFTDCKALETIDLSKVTDIGSYAFRNCKSLEKIDLSSIVSLESRSFQSCEGIKELYIGPNLSYACIPFGYLCICDIDGETPIYQTADNLKDSLILKTGDRLVKNIRYAVSFDSDGGSEVPAMDVFSGKTVSKPEDPVKAGYEFICWTLDGKEYDFSGVMPKHDIVLVAEWVPALFPISIPDGLTVTKADGTVVHDGDAISYGTALSVVAKEKQWYTAKIYFNGKELTDGKFIVDLENVLILDYVSNCIVEFPRDVIVTQNGTPLMSGDAVDYGAVLTAIPVARTGYIGIVYLNGEVLSDWRFTVGETNVLTVIYKPHLSQLVENEALALPFQNLLSIKTNEI